MGKINLPKGCKPKQIGIKDAVEIIKEYWADNPSFLCYDGEETIGKDRIDNTIQKAYRLNLRNKNKCCANKNLRNWLRDNTNEKTLISQYWEDRKNRKDKSLKWVGKALFTKAAHKLYPKVLPIIDGKIYDSYRRNVGTNNLVKIAEEILKDCENNNKDKCLQNLCDTLCKTMVPQKIKISPLRAWDILVWSTIKK